MKLLLNNIRNLILFITVVLFVNFKFSNECKAESTKDIKSILFLIDVSGSMKGAKIDSVKSAAKRIITMLLPCNTEFAVMGYSGKPENPIPYQHHFTNNKSELLYFIDSLQPNSNTPLATALKTASYYFKHNKNPLSTKQTIILLGDGRSDDNISLALNELKERNSIVQCECIGFCLKNDKQAEEQLKQIASETHGEYYVSTEATNVIKAFLKTSIKSIIGDIPVVVRTGNTFQNLKTDSKSNFNNITNQNWIVDSIQVNVSADLYVAAQMITDENMQDTLPKSIVFDSNKNVSLFLSNGSKTDANKKWVEGKYIIDKNSLIIKLPDHYIKLIIKKFDKHSLVFCVNKYRSYVDSMIEGGEICECKNKLTPGKPTILVYCSLPGCSN